MNSSLLLYNNIRKVFHLLNYRHIIFNSSHIMNAKLSNTSKMEDGFLEEDLVSKNPIKQFEHWFNIARKTNGITVPHAMNLSTIKSNGRPAARMVLLQGFGEDGFKFYTSASSAKAAQIEKNPHVALVFYWMPLNRSVRIEGKVEDVSDDVADSDFASRPRVSQLAMHVSDKQSLPIASRNSLMCSLEKVTEVYRDTAVPRPEFWQGHIVKPDLIEFWQGHVTRICDRIVFTKGNNSSDTFLKTGENKWVFQRLGP